VAAVLHVLNGDAAATALDRTEVPGDRLVWRDILVEGPVPAQAHAPLPARAAFLAERLGIDALAYARTTAEQVARLAAAAPRHDEVVLWFEQDLFCAVTLWSLLDWFAHRASTTRLSLVYPACDVEARGLGALESAQLAGLFAGRQPVTEAARALGAEGWAAYANPAPMAAQALLARAPEALPFVAGAMRCHLGRFPSVATGLNEVETVTLEALIPGPRGFGDLFREVGGHPRVVLHGMGDVQFAACLRRLVPLVRSEGDEHAITPRAHAVLAGAEDWLAVRPIDTWLGGVRLRGDCAAWRWDGRELVPSPGAGYAPGV
jgi:hypothetical protein